MQYVFFVIIISYFLFTVPGHICIVDYVSFIAECNYFKREHKYLLMTHENP